MQGPREHMRPQLLALGAPDLAPWSSPPSHRSVGLFHAVGVPLHARHPRRSSSEAHSWHLDRGWAEPSKAGVHLSQAELAGWPHQVHAGRMGRRVSPCSYQWSIAHPALSWGREHRSLLEHVMVRRLGGVKTWVPMERPPPHSPITFSRSPPPLRSSPGGLRRVCIQRISSDAMLQIWSVGPSPQE